MTEKTKPIYQSARDQGQKMLYESLLAVAEAILIEEGAGGLSMRRVAAAAGCSTTVLYTLFGSKNGIIDALFVEGFQRLSTAHAALPPAEDATSAILDLCRTYRQVALSNPMHYRIMFGNPIPDFKPSPQSLATALEAMRPLTEAVERGMTDGVFDVTNADDFAMMLWSVAHGFVSLEMAGMQQEPERAEFLYEATLRRLLNPRLTSHSHAG